MERNAAEAAELAKITDLMWMSERSLLIWILPK
jgi:hypothetical protein